MWLIVQYGVSEAVSTKTSVFLCCLTLSGWFDWIGILYASIHIKSNLETAKQNTVCEAPENLKWIIAAHAKLFIILILSSSQFFFLFSKPSAKMADVGKLF